MAFKTVNAGENVRSIFENVKSHRVEYNVRKAVTFGSYWDKDYKEGEKDPIEWQILEEYNDAFTLDEEEAIIQADVKGFNGTEDTQDSIFLISEEEIKKYSFEEYYMDKDDSNGQEWTAESFMTPYKDDDDENDTWLDSDKEKIPGYRTKTSEDQSIFFKSKTGFKKTMKIK